MNIVDNIIQVSFRILGIEEQGFLGLAGQKGENEGFRGGAHCQDQAVDLLPRHLLPLPLHKETAGQGKTSSR